MTYQCCFCGNSIQGKQPRVEIAVGLMDGGGTQGLYCHGACLADALHPSVPAAFPEAGTVYMPLLDEGTPAWRPVEARKVAKDRYLIPKSVLVPEDEVWFCQPGSTVRCELHVFQGGMVGLIVVGT